VFQELLKELSAKLNGSSMSPAVPDTLEMTAVSPQEENYVTDSNAPFHISVME
jgi:hypothetical protein